MLIHSRTTALISAAAAIGILGAIAAPPLPALGAPARPAKTAAPAWLATPAAPAARATPAAALPSGAASQFGSDLAKAFTISNGGGVTVAVLSTGVDRTAADLTGRVTIGPDYTGSAHPVPFEGTLVAGLIAGSGPSEIDNGIAPAARILSIRTGEDSSEPGVNGFYDNAGFNDIDARAIHYAAGHGAQVIFIDSLSGDVPSQALESAVHDAAASGVVIVADDEYFYSGFELQGYDDPTSMPGVVGVGSVNLQRQPAPYENSHSVQNESVLIAAPGNSESEPGPDGQSYSIDGPEAAAAIVAGTVALIKSVYPRLSPMLVDRALALSARYHPPGGYNTTLGFGLVNPYGALTEASQLAKLAGADASPAVAVSVPGGQDATATFRSGAPLPAIEAVHHPVAKLAGYGAAAVGGLICLLGAFLLWRRLRRRPRTGRAAPGGVSQQLAEPQ